MRQYYYQQLDKLIRFVKPTIVLKNVVGDLEDVQITLESLRRKARGEDRLLITYYNHLWEPVLKLASWLGWRKQVKEQNWLDSGDLTDLLYLAGWEAITVQQKLLIPVDIPAISYLVNYWIAPLPLINSLCLLTWLIARPIHPRQKQQYSVSIVIPARNEAGNIPHILKQIPRFGRWQEVIFVEGHSQDDTWEIIQKVKSQKSKVKIRAYKQKGIGKADAVRLGFDKARGELLMILDADLSVRPQELTKFYHILATGSGDFANGSRLVYPMEKQAMRMINKLGNKIFSWLFTWILGQKFKDTLCGTKALFRKDYQKIKKGRKFFGEFDPFGDYDLIFGAVKQNLKTVEIPIRYRERQYGSTNISRFIHGWLLLKMTWFAFKKFRL